MFRKIRKQERKKIAQGDEQNVGLKEEAKEREG